MIDNVGFQDMRNYVKRRISYGRYRVGSTFYDVPLSKIELLPSGVVRAQLSIPASGNVVVNRVELLNGDRQLWAHQDCNIALQTGQTGILYWFDFNIHECECEED